MKKISIIIPVYNTEKYLRDCLISIENQTYKDFEIVLVDDGSTDGSVQFCDQYKKEHKNVVVIHQKNGGASAARNTGILAASGDYIHFIDSDDILIKNDAYENFYRIITEFCPDIILSRCTSYTDNFLNKIKEQPPYDTIGFFSGDLLFEVINKNYEMTLTSPVNKVFKRSFLIDNDLFFSIGIDHEEDEWLPRVICKVKKTYFHNELFYGVRCNRPNSLSETKTDDVKARKACSKIYIAHSGMDYMQEQSLPKPTLSKIANYYWDYFIDACVTYNEIKDRNNKNRIFVHLKKHKDFLKSYKLLDSNNRRVLGLMFKFLGIRITLRTIRLRYR